MKPVLTPDELAERWSMSRESLAYLRYQGRGPRFFKAGRLVRYRLADVEAFEAERAGVAS